MGQNFQASNIDPDLDYLVSDRGTVIDTLNTDLIPDRVRRDLMMDQDTRVNTDPLGQHLNHVMDIAREDAEGLIKGDPKYGYSWKKRGGVGAYMMATRKFDRLDNSLQPVDDVDREGYIARLGRWLEKPIRPFDILEALRHDTRSEGVIDDIRDLRRYLLLIEAEARAQGIIHGPHRDNQE
jgi:hypothetical protein